jgi:hypothetical protein
MLCVIFVRMSSELWTFLILLSKLAAHEAFHRRWIFHLFSLFFSVVDLSLSVATVTFLLHVFEMSAVIIGFFKRWFSVLEASFWWQEEITTRAPSCIVSRVLNSSNGAYRLSQPALIIRLQLIADQFFLASCCCQRLNPAHVGNCV